jgi:predicted nuclease with TOPRIM domain
LSDAERIINEIERSPALAERFRKIVENIVLSEVLAEQRALRTELNRMLQEQIKIAEEQRRLREEFIQLRADFAKLVDGQKSLREDFTRLAEDQKILREDFAKLVDEQRRLREDFTKMLQELADLRRGYIRLEDHVQSLYEAMIGGFGELSKFAGITFEDFTRKFLENYLKAQGALPKDKQLAKHIVDSEEIHIYCDDPHIVGEVTAHAESEEEVEKLLRKVDLVRCKLGSEPRKYLIILTAPRSVANTLEESRQNNIELIIGKNV